MSAVDGVDWTQIGAVGTLGLAVTGFIKGWIVPGKVHDRELERNDKQATQLEALQTAIQDEFLPTFRDSVDALKAVTPLLNPVDRNVGPSGGG